MSVVRIAVAIMMIALLGAASFADEVLLWPFESDPFALSREAAMEGRDQAFKAIGLPAETVTQILRVTTRPGEKMYIASGYRFMAVVTSGFVVHHDVLVTDGESLAAEKWSLRLKDGALLIFLVSLSNGNYFWSIKLSSSGSALAHVPFTANPLQSAVARAT